MKIYEAIENLKQTTNLNIDTLQEDFDKVETELVTLVNSCFTNSKVECNAYGDGIVVGVTGATFDDVIAEIAFKAENKKFSLKHIILNTKFVTFIDSDLLDIYNKAFEVHTEFKNTYLKLRETKRLNTIEAKKKAEAEKKAEAKYQKQKEHAFQTFDQLVANASTTLSENDKFYYALGWLVNHIGTLTAILPDYLGPAFEKHFGTDAPKTLVDGRAKTSGGYAKQWSWEFKCTIKKLKETVVPTVIQNVTTDFSKGIHNTAFLWDLVENYGFQFGKKQDIGKIKDTIPAQFTTSFEAGLTA